jgi:hypothetical protein
LKRFYFTIKKIETKSNEMCGIRYGHSNYDSLYNEAGILALQEAKVIASNMAEEMGVEIGEIINISNEKNVANQTYFPSYYGGFSASIFGLGGSAGGGGYADGLANRRSGYAEIKPGIMKVNNISYLSFRIK